MTVTIKDVARAAGVSVATVSRVLNDSGPVSAETRRRIREIARQLRYTPNGAARSLITSRTTTLGVLLPDLHGEFFSEVIRGTDQAAQERGYHLLVSSSHNVPSEIEAALTAMRGRVDGLVIMSPAIDAATLASTVPATLPVVLLNCAVGDDAFDALNVDNFGGAYAMTRHLLTRGGRRRVAMVCGAPGNADAAERLAGYRAALRDGRAERRRGWELPGDFQQRSGYDAAQRLLAMSPRPDALFAANDSMAIGALSALREGGVRVPEEVAVAGFDDIPIARYMSPPLTTVRVDIAGLGGRAVEMLVDAVERKNAHRRRQETVPVELLVRGSCGGA
ncbi:MAG: LacI family DNA-binding transcriptional regulator [Gemmatimonadaceae bacterium]